jgi:hypothetical protein
MAIMNEAYIFYTHSEYSDIWPIMVSQTNKFLPNKKKYLFSNKVDNSTVFDGWEIILYNENNIYTKRVSSCLEQVCEDVVIFHHEDMFLYSEPDFEVISRLVDKVEKGEAEIIKFCRASYNNIPDPKFDKFIHYTPINLRFAIQPSVFLRNALIDIFLNAGGQTIWEFEVKASNYVLQKQLKSFYYYTGKETKRGQYHWDSFIYPYVATAVAKGKWDFECYPNLLNKLLRKHNIDPNIRGKNA